MSRADVLFLVKVDGEERWVSEEEYIELIREGEDTDD